ncbi:MAG: hypothetical protein HY674_16255 [Chloroflexi bacterium]|nr:hypothetical protein [Chloroflexota bacterium]
MNLLTKGKIILYLAAIFVAGGISGGVIAWKEAKQEMSRPPSPKKMCAFFRERLQAELKLTADQVQRLEPLLEKRVQEMEAVHSRTIGQIDELFRASNEEIARTLGLTPEQRLKLDEMEKKRAEFMRKKFKPPEREP